MALSSVGHTAMNLVDSGPDPNAPWKEKVLSFTEDALRRMLFYRRQYDQRRAYFYRQYVGQRDQKFYPDNITPRSNTFVPYALSNVETVVSRFHDSLFSLDDWFETRGRNTQDEPKAEKMHQILRYILHKAKFGEAIETLVRNLAIYGHAGLKVDWDWTSEEVMSSTRIPMTDPATGQPMMDQSGQPAIQGIQATNKTVPRACPRLIPIDVYDLVVDPDGTMCAHITERTWRQMQDEQAGNPKMYFQEGLDELSRRLENEKNPEEVLIRIAEVWNQNDNSWTMITADDGQEALKWKDLRATYRAATYSPYKKRVYSGPGVLLFHDKNPFAHKRNPILHTSFIKLPNELFGLGEIEIISDINEGINRFVNMITDNWNLGINSRYGYDINADIDHEALNQFNVPGGKVGTSGDPSKILYPLPTHTPTPGDYEIINLYKGVLEMASGVSDFYSKGVGSPSGNRTSTGISQVISEGGFRFKIFIRNLAMDILEPLLEMVTSMVQQYLPEQVAQMITADPQVVPAVLSVAPEEMLGNFTYEISATNYTTNKTIRQRNLMALAGIISQSQYVDERFALREMLKAFDIRNLDRIIKSEQQVQQEQQMQQQQQIAMMKMNADLQLREKVAVEHAKAEGQTVHEVAKGYGEKISGKYDKAPGEKKKGGKEGRPSTGAHPTPIPGSNHQGAIRSLAQSLGANALGLGGTEGGE